MNRTGHYAELPGARSARARRLVEHVAPRPRRDARGRRGRSWLAVGRVRRRRPPSGSRLVTIGVPPDVDPRRRAAAVVGLARPSASASRAAARRPAASLLGDRRERDGNRRFGCGCPQTIPPGLDRARRLLGVAWRERHHRAGPGTTQPGDRGWCRCAPSYALRAGLVFAQAAMSPDPLPLILGQLAGLRGGSSARSCRSSRGRRRSVSNAGCAPPRGGMRAGVPTSRASRGCWTASHAPAHRSRRRSTRRSTPMCATVMGKSTQPLYRCLVRVTVTAPRSAEARGRIHAILGGFAAYDGAGSGCAAAASAGRRRQAARARLGRRAFLCEHRGARGARAPARRARRFPAW